MDQENNLYDKYIERALGYGFSAKIPDVTKKATLEKMNSAINLCERWDSVLDVGCGNGHYLAALAGKFRKAVGIEMDHFREQDALAERHKNISFFRGPVESYKDSGATFDFILLMDIFEHIPDIDEFMSHISKLQKKGGILYVVTPNPLFCGPAAESSIYFKNSGYHGHIRHYSSKEVLEICSKAGYQPEFTAYEETNLRATYYLLSRGLSRRDERYSKNALYRLIRPLLAFPLHIISSWIEHKCYKEEMKNIDNIFSTRSFCVALKKN